MTKKGFLQFPKLTLFLMLIFACKDSNQGRLYRGRTMFTGKTGYSNGIYYGSTINGVPFGRGKYLWREQDMYLGDWAGFVGAMIEGYGVCQWSNGDKYTGQFKQNKKWGLGKYEWANGDVFEGGWVNDVRDGYGKYVWHNCEVYEGHWKYDKFNGAGILMTNDGTYEGEWKNNLKHGKGKLVYTNYFKFDGEWNNDCMHGYGSQTWHDGATYEGVFWNGLFHGTGKYIWNFGWQYQGEWKDQGMHGQGIITKGGCGSESGEWHCDKCIKGCTFFMPEPFTKQLPKITTPFPQQPPLTQPPHKEEQAMRGCIYTPNSEIQHQPDEIRLQVAESEVEKSEEEKSEEEKSEEEKSGEAKSEEEKSEEGKSEEGKSEEEKSEEGKSEEGKSEEGKSEDGKSEEEKSDLLPNKENEEPDAEAEAEPKFEKQVILESPLIENPSCEIEGSKEIICSEDRRGLEEDAAADQINKKNFKQEESKIEMRSGIEPVTLNRRKKIRLMDPYS